MGNSRTTHNVVHVKVSDLLSRVPHFLLHSFSQGWCVGDGGVGARIVYVGAEYGAEKQGPRDVLSVSTSSSFYLWNNMTLLCLSSSVNIIWPR